MQTKKVKSGIIWSAVAIALVILIIIPMIVIDKPDTYRVIRAAAIGLLSAGLTLGIMTEMKKIFGVTWRRPFFTAIGFVYLVGSGFLPIPSLFSTERGDFWPSRLLFVLFSLPILYFSLLLYRNHSKKETNEA